MGIQSNFNTIVNTILKKTIFIFVIGICIFLFMNSVNANEINPSIENICTGDDLGVKLITIFGTVLNIIRIAVPILLIIFGTIDLLKAVIASKEDEMKKSQKLLINRFIAAVVVILIVTIVKLVIRLVADVTEDEASNSIINTCFKEIGW